MKTKEELREIIINMPYTYSDEEKICGICTKDELVSAVKKYIDKYFESRSITSDYLVFWNKSKEEGMYTDGDEDDKIAVCVILNTGKIEIACSLDFTPFFAAKSNLTLDKMVDLLINKQKTYINLNTPAYIGFEKEFKNVLDYYIKSIKCG